MSSEENRINSVVETALKNLNSMLDVSTVIGKPVKTDDGDLVLPVAKVTLGVISGGGEYGKLGLFKKGSDLPFSAGNGAIVSVKPSGFLIKNCDGNYKILSVESGAYEKIMEKATDFLSELTVKDE